MREKINLDHTQQSLRKAFGINKERHRTLVLVLAMVMTESEGDASKIVQEIFNKDDLPLNERLYLLWRACETMVEMCLLADPKEYINKKAILDDMICKSLKGVYDGKIRD